ncbi:MAG TPA: hypothetical protein VFI25_17910 [Planctomycetota bacterium]|jgi:hypothetical protein|nr:hypothetical protein [Planctomycetota bacterium]
MKRDVRGFALLALAGCASGDRMFRIQPFSRESAPGPDRVNLWPLAYVNRDEVALLWPLIDFDDRGFAVRPLVAKDETRWSILYPWASFDTATGEGWVAPFYNVGGYKGIFPVAGFGERSYVGPAYWKTGPNGAVESGGLFPLVRLSGEWSYVGPVFWDRDDRGELESAGLFPVAAVNRGWGYALTAWWDRGPGGEVESWGVLPLFGTGKLDHLGPLWRKKGADGDASSFGLFPLVWADADGKELAVFPFYAHSLSEQARLRTFLLGLATFRRTGTTETDWVLPLWFRDEREGAADEVLFPLFYKRSRGDRSQVFTLLGDRRVEGKESGLNLYPVWWSSDSLSGRFRMLVPLCYYKEEGTRRTLLTPLGGRGWDVSGEGGFVNVLGPLFHSSASESGEDRTLSFLWPLVEHQRRGGQSSTRVVPLFGTTSKPGETETWFAAGIGGFHSGATGSSWRLSPLAAASTEKEAPGLLYEATLFRSHRFADRSETRLLPLYEGRRDPGRAEDSLLLGLGWRRRDPEGTSWRLWPLASYSTDLAFRPGLGNLTLLGIHESKEGSRLDVAAPFLFRLDRSRSGAERSARFLLFFTYDAFDRPLLEVPTAEEDSEWNLFRSRKLGFLLDGCKDETRESRVWKEGILRPEEIGILEPWSPRFDADPRSREERDPRAARTLLEAHGAPVPGEEAGEVKRAVVEFARENTELRRRRHVRIPFLFHYRGDGEEGEWSALLGLVGSEKKKDRSRFSLLYSFFRAETEGDRTTRDIFPFLTWDSGPDEKRVSFLWRVFRYERVGGRRSGHVLFIPWGGS